MFDQGTNLVLMGKSPDFLVVVPVVTEKNINTLGIAFDQGRGDLAIVSSSHVNQGLRSPLNRPAVSL